MASEPVPTPREDLRERRRRYREKLEAAVQARKLRLYEEVWAEVLRREMAAIPRVLEFRVKYDTVMGQELHLVGSTPETGSWDLARSLHMYWTEGNIWVCKVKLPATVEKVEYKYVVKGNGNSIWENGSNHVFQVTASSGTQSQLDRWGAV